MRDVINTPEAEKLNSRRINALGTLRILAGRLASGMPQVPGSTVCTELEGGRRSCVSERLALFRRDQSDLETAPLARCRLRVLKIGVLWVTDSDFPRKVGELLSRLGQFSCMDRCR